MAESDSVNNRNAAEVGAEPSPRSDQFVDMSRVFCNKSGLSLLEHEFKYK